MKPLTPRQKQYLTYCNGFWLRHGRPPSVRQIGRALGVRSTNGVVEQLDAIEAKGFPIVRRTRDDAASAEPGTISAWLGAHDEASDALDRLSQRLQAEGDAQGAQACLLGAVALRAARTRVQALPMPNAETTSERGAA